MGTTTRYLASCACALVLAAGCGNKGDDFSVPPGGSGEDGGVRDAPHIDAPPADSAFQDAAIVVDAPPGNPTITLISPQPETLISGVMTLHITASAPSTVKQVTATIDGSDAIPMGSTGGSDWIGEFDTRVLTGLLFPTIVVRAQAVTGEEAQLGFEVVLDNEPPVASLDPPDVRQEEVVTGGLECSVPFDPLGGDAPNDGESVTQISELRARVVDQGNIGTFDSTLFVPVATVQYATLYVFDDTNQPLVVDTDGDGICDAINPKIVPAITPQTSNEAAVVQLDGVAPAGAAFFGPTTINAPNTGVCASGSDTAPPAPLCAGEPNATLAVQTDFGAPEIYGIPEVSADNCLGFGFDFKASNISNGWACAAVLTADKLGNTSVSAPLRVCVDSDVSGQNCLPWGQIAVGSARPDCTGTVDGSGNVTNTPCTPAVFPKPGQDFELIAPTQ